MRINTVFQSGNTMDAVSVRAVSLKWNCRLPVAPKRCGNLRPSSGRCIFGREVRIDSFLSARIGGQLTEAGKSPVQGAGSIVRYCKGSAFRAENAGHRNAQIIRLGTSPMTPAQVPVNLWPKRQGDCPDHTCLHMGRPDSAVPIVFPPNVPAIQFAESAAVSGNGVILR